MATAYDEALAGELAAKPLDRSLLRMVTELAGQSAVADVGCGPGHVTRFLAAEHPAVLGIDLSPAMIAIARDRAPGLGWTVGSMLSLPVADAALGAVVCFYAIIHLDSDDRALACREFARVLVPGGWLLVAFHVSSAELASGEAVRLSSWFGEQVDLVTRFLDPSEVVADLESAGFVIMASADRPPVPGAEYPSRRCYLLAERRP